MALIDVRGNWGAHLALLHLLFDPGHAIRLTREARHAADDVGLVLVALDHDLSSPTLEVGPNDRRPRWLAWNPTDAPNLTLAAYRNGAVAVLPAATTPEVLRAAVDHALATGEQDQDGALPGRPQSPAARGRVFRRGDQVVLDRSDVLDIEAGVLAQRVVHADGAEVLLGLVGPGGMVIGHGPDGCGLRLQAQTELTATIQDWTVAARDPEFPTRITARLRQMEAWAAMQARPSLDQRLLGLLGLLAEAFGGDHTDGTLVDVRITHAQLASAIGATRTTVTRLLGDLRSRGLLAVAGHGTGERFVLPISEARHGAHVHRHHHV